MKTKVMVGIVISLGKFSNYATAKKALQNANVKVMLLHTKTKPVFLSEKQ